MNILSRFRRSKSATKVTGSALDAHFEYTNAIQQSSRGWRKNPKAKAKTVQLCERQIGISESAIKAWRSNYPVGKMPRHVGFQTLAMMREHDKDYGGSIELCQTAKKHGWSGDWEKRISRCRAKAAKPR
ncbi:hypothetical protein BH23CHL5_BH23CHL5_28260 [soil metagenome]